MNFKIDSDIPVPSELCWREKLDLLEVGDSIKVFSGSEKTVRIVSNEDFHKKGTKRFTTRIDPRDIDNYRTWRIE